MLWVVTYYNPVVFKLYTGRRYFFLLWIVVLLLMEVLFFLAYVLSERNTTYVAAGAGANGCHPGASACFMNSSTFAPDMRDLYCCSQLTAI